MNLYQHAKKQGFSLVRSRDIVDLKLCNLIRQEHFGTYLSNQIFTNYKIFGKMV